MSETEKKDDLGWQKQDETDNLQKSENPDGEYMKDKGLCVVCHGVRKKCDKAGCPQNY